MAAHKISLNDDLLPLPTEVQMVGGLLRWTMSADTSACATRSALVARVAEFLRSIGHSTGRIQTWNGAETYPTNLDRNAVVVVLGGFLSDRSTNA